MQNADGSWGSYTNDGTTSVAYGSTCSYSKSVTNYKASASGTNGGTASTSATMNSTIGITVSLDFYRNTYTLTVNRNSTYISSASASTSAVHGSNYYRWGQSVNISATASSGNEFTSWSLSSGSGTFGNSSSASTTFTMSTGNATIYANEKQSCIGTITTTNNYIQNINISTNYCVGATGTLTDSRDNNSYTVAKLADGTIWMTQNLRLGGSNAITLNYTDTNLASGASYTLPATSAVLSSGYASIHISTTNDSGNYFDPNEGDYGETYYSKFSYIEKYNGTDSSSSWTTSGVTTELVGGYYNYIAATAGTISGNSSYEAQYDICPKGWRLPTKNEFYNLYSAYGSDVKRFSNAFQTILAGHYNAEYALADAQSGYPGGYYWTSTAASSTIRYVLTLSRYSVSISDYQNGYWHPSPYSSAATMRCIAR